MEEAFGENYKNNIDKLKLINDFDWLKDMFNKHINDRK